MLKKKPIKQPEVTPLKSGKNNRLQGKTGLQVTPSQTDYSKYKIDYEEIDKALVKYDGCKITNKQIYHISGWSESKFYKICKENIQFVQYILGKRELGHVKHIRFVYSHLMKQVKVGNVSAITFALRNLGYDGIQSVVEEKQPEEDPNTLKPEDFTLAELKQIAKFKDAARKRKAKKVKK